LGSHTFFKLNYKIWKRNWKKELFIEVKWETFFSLITNIFLFRHGLLLGNKFKLMTSFWANVFDISTLVKMACQIKVVISVLFIHFRSSTAGLALPVFVNFIGSAIIIDKIGQFWIFGLWWPSLTLIGLFGLYWPVMIFSGYGKCF
jgi:hypothetical protein